MRYYTIENWSYTNCLTKDLVRLRGWIIIRDNLVKQKVSSIKLLETFS